MSENLNTIFTAEKLFTAYQTCLKRKKKTVNAVKFELRREENLFKLLQDLQNGKYKISRHICFVIKKPKPREIFAADFRDRVVHHLVYNEISEIFEKDFISNSYSNRRKMGTHKAIRDLKQKINWRGIHNQNMYYLKADIKNFFRSINKDILWQIVRRKITEIEKPDWWKDEILWLIQMIIFYNPTSNFIFKGSVKDKKLIPKHKSLLVGSDKKGLPIGNLTSQFFANVYLNELDQFIWQKLKPRKYFRYVDDFLIIHKSAKFLKKLLLLINNFVQKKLSLKIHPRKWFIQKVSSGIDFVGYYLKPNYVLVRKAIVCRMKQTIKTVAFKKKIKYRQSCSASYFGYFSHANCFRLIHTNFIPPVIDF